MKYLKYLFTASILTLIGCNNSTTNREQENTTKKVDVDICKCLFEPSNSEYIIQNGTACDEALSKEIGVADWKKVNMKYDKVTSKKWDELVYKCTGIRPSAEISGTYSGLDNFGFESTIILLSDGTFIHQSLTFDGTPKYGWWTGTADNLSLYLKDEMGNEELIARAEVTEDGLTIIGGKFYSRQ